MHSNFNYEEKYFFLPHLTEIPSITYIDFC
jgi:hypothetical protein